MANKSYFNPEDLKKFGNITDFQEVMGKKFFDWYGEVFKEGALTEREKALICAFRSTCGAMSLLHGRLHRHLLAKRSG